MYCMDLLLLLLLWSRGEWIQFASSPREISIATHQDTARFFNPNDEGHAYETITQPIIPPLFLIVSPAFPDHLSLPSSKGQTAAC